MFETNADVFFPCCYRVAPDGEIVYTEYNIYSLDVKNIPMGLFNPSENTDMSISVDELRLHKDIDGYAFANNALCSSDSALIALCSYGVVYVFDNKGNRYLFKDNVRGNYVPYKGYSIDNKWAYPIGLRCQDYRTFRSTTEIPKIYIDKRDNTIYTTGGKLTLGFDINYVDSKSIDRYLSYGYLQASNRDAFGLIYYKNKARVAYAVNGELILREEV